MASKKTSTKQQRSRTKSTPTKIKIAGMSFTQFSPTSDLIANPKLIAHGLAEAFMDGDKEAFQEILEAYLKSREITKTAKKMKISRTVIYESFNKRNNPSLESLCKIMKAFKNAEIKRKAA